MIPALEELRKETLIFSTYICISIPLTKLYVLGPCMIATSHRQQGRKSLKILEIKL